MTPSPHRFTPNGSPSLEQHLHQVCLQVRDGIYQRIPEKFRLGLLLGGGYGRGEGGVLTSPQGDLPYNDLEFYLIVPGNGLLTERRYHHLLHQLAEKLSPAAGIEVEFKILGIDRLRQRGPSMFTYDLVLGHHWLFGDDSLLAGCDAHRDASRIPLAEATRLLMNRCSGLFFSATRLALPNFTPDDADFIGRNLAKAQLAMGDAVLTALGQYHWSCIERHRRLCTLPPPSLPALASLTAFHAAGVDFKFHPVRSSESQADLARRHQVVADAAAQVWLWIEHRRLGTSHPTPLAYALHPEDKCPETASWRNRLINARAFGPALALAPSGARHPRERLLRSLCLLLWSPSHLTDPTQLAALHRWLRATPDSPAAWNDAYHRFWTRFQ